LAQHGKYANNYDYHKAIWLLNKEEVVENGFLLVKSDASLVSPIGTLYVERYSDVNQVVDALADRAEDIQVVTVREGVSFKDRLQEQGLRTVRIGHNQCPGLEDHADGVDTMGFLLGLQQPSTKA
jgi:hypothetical protein